MRISSLFLLLFLSALALPNLAQSSADTASVQAVAEEGDVDSRQMSTDLQRLPWKPFKAIIEAVPKLASDVNAYGPLGWQFVKENYKTYDWKKKIDKLDAVQKKQLAELIKNAKAAQ